MGQGLSRRDVGVLSAGAVLGAVGAVAAAHACCCEGHGCCKGAKASAPAPAAAAGAGEGVESRLGDAPSVLASLAPEQRAKVPPVGAARRIAVFCGSSMPKDPQMEQAADRLGEELAKQGIELIYGGGNIGLMGVISRAVDRHGGVVRGIIPESLAAREVVGQPVQEENEVVVATMHQRKELMAVLSCGFIALPGGFGTFEEVMESVTWTQLNVHRKAVVLFDVNGYYQPMMKQVADAVRLGFIKPGASGLLQSSDDPAELIRQVLTFEPEAGAQVNLTWGTKNPESMT